MGLSLSVATPLALPVASSLISSLRLPLAAPFPQAVRQQCDRPAGPGGHSLINKIRASDDSTTSRTPSHSLTRSVSCAAPPTNRQSTHGSGAASTPGVAGSHGQDAAGQLDDRGSGRLRADGGPLVVAQRHPLRRTQRATGEPCGWVCGWVG